jgi:hypothetical protein
LAELIIQEKMMSRERALVTNPDHYVLKVIAFILIACVGALVFGAIAG